MAISFTNQVSPAVPNEPSQEPIQKKNSSIPLIAGTIAGAGIGLYAGIKKNPNISKQGDVADTFATKAYEKYAQSSETLKRTYNQTIEILNKIKTIKNVDDLKYLFESNKEAVKAFCSGLGQSVEDFTKSITKENLEANKKAITKQLETINKSKIQSMKNWIQSCWDKANKEFVKPDDIKQEVFDAIKDATKGRKAKLVTKYTAIGAVVGGVGTFILSKVLKNKNENPDNMDPNNTQQ